MQLFKKEKTSLDELIDTVQTQMFGYDADSDEFKKAAKRLDLLYKMRSSTSTDRLNINTAVAVVGNLAGILLILNHERLHVVTSKALSFVLKTRT